MNTREIFWMNWCFAALYFPTSVLLWMFNQKGTLLGVILVGLVFHAIMTIILLILWLAREKQKVEVIPLKRTYKKKPKGVKENADKTEHEMRTDVNLDQLDINDDDNQ